MFYLDGVLLLVPRDLETKYGRGWIIAVRHSARALSGTPIDTVYWIPEMVNNNAFDNASEPECHSAGTSFHIPLENLQSRSEG